MKKITILTIALLLVNFVKAQQHITFDTLPKSDGTFQIKGMLKGEVGQKIALYGFKNFDTYKLAEITVDSIGRFAVSYKDYQGMAYLKSTISDKATSMLVLNQEMIKLKGTSLLELDSLKVSGSQENKLFKQYAMDYASRSNVYAAWYYLSKSYEQTPIFKKQKSTIKAISSEMNRLDKANNTFLKKIDKNFYMSWYLPLRKLINDMPASVYKYNEHILKNIEDFRQINFNDKRFYHSGIFSKLLETHYWMLENSSGSIGGDIYPEMNKSTDYILDSLQDNEELLNEVTSYLFHLLEKRSLFKASEYLALKMLNQNACVLDEKLTNQLESYRAMKVGNIAPDIDFKKGVKIVAGKEEKAKKSLSKYKHKNTLVIFGASWCPKCKEELPKIQLYYNDWKTKDVEVVFVSLDTDKEAFLNFSKNFPWLSYCDMNGWDSKISNDYYIFSTPTMFLLDANRKILVRPVSVEHANTWINYKLNK